MLSICLIFGQKKILKQSQNFGLHTNHGLINQTEKDKLTMICLNVREKCIEFFILESFGYNDKIIIVNTQFMKKAIFEYRILE